MKDSFTVSTHEWFVCPICERGEVGPFSTSATCDVCGYALSELTLKEIREILSLPDAQGYHACECGHPEMRRLPDGVYWCPSCGSEVLPVEGREQPESPPQTA